MKPIDLSGQQFGRLTVIARAENTHQGFARWICKCECGNEKVIVGTSLTRRNPTQSCGCRHREACVERSTKHGHATNGISPTYHSWASAIARCENPKNRRYADWGGRGIKVCERWHDFRNFLEDMGEKPAGLSIDRINNDGDYEPGNCRWATLKQQRSNRRNGTNSHILELNGERRTVTEWAAHLGVPAQRLYNRIRYGWPVERTLTP